MIIVNGNDKTLTKEEKDGLNTFIDKVLCFVIQDIALVEQCKPFELVAKYKF